MGTHSAHTSYSSADSGCLGLYTEISATSAAGLINDLAISIIDPLFLATIGQAVTCDLLKNSNAYFDYDKFINHSQVNDILYFQFG